MTTVNTVTGYETKISTEEATRKTIEGMENIKIVDTNDDLDVFCYTKCSNEDSDLVKGCRGVVYNDDKVVMKAFPYTTEYTDLNQEMIKVELNDTNIEECLFFDSHEGALVRLFFFKKWYVSTHRKLDAFKSKWSSKESFGDLFLKGLEQEEINNKNFADSLGEGETLLERFQGTLDENKQYMFLVCNNDDNRIVCLPPKNPKIYHVGTFIDGELSTERSLSICSPKKMEFETVLDLCNYASGVDYNQIQGIICFMPNNSQFKVYSSKYKDLYDIRGNEPSVKYRYLQIRMDRKKNSMIYYLYPNSAQLFDEYENILFDIARNIYNAYVNRYIKKMYVTMPSEEFYVMKECHTWHLRDKKKNRISLDFVISIMNKQQPTNLNHMIRRFKTDQLKKDETTGRTKPRNGSVNHYDPEEKRPTPKPLQKQKHFSNVRDQRDTQASRGRNRQKPVVKPIVAFAVPPLSRSEEKDNLVNSVFSEFPALEGNVPIKVVAERDPMLGPKPVGDPISYKDAMA
jgi:hypothetical protein